MSEQQDKDIVNRIKEVFDNYEDTTADEGWLLLRERFPEKEKKRPGLMPLWWCAAALLLIALGVGLWKIETPPQEQNITQNRHQPKILNQNTGHVDSADNLAKPAAHSKDHTTGLAVNGAAGEHKSLQNIAITSHTAGVHHATSSRSNQNLAIAGNYHQNHQRSKAPKENERAGKNKESGKDHTANETLATAFDAGNNHAINKVINKTDKPGADLQEIAANTGEKQKNLNAIPPAAGVTQTDEKGPDHAEPSKQMEQLLARDKAGKNIKEARKENSDSKTGKKVILGVYAATYYSSSKGSNNQLNGGGGISSDIRLGKKFSLSTGIAIGQNNLTYNNNTPSQSVVALATTAPTKIRFMTVGAKYASSSPSVLKKYDINLVGLDIPFNFKYQLSARKTDPYLSAGFSSGTFINETYTHSYTYLNTYYHLADAQPQDEVVRKSFGSFNFIKTLNLSFGVGTQLGKSNRVVIEPFVKYPFLGAGAQNVKFTSSGVNLKFVFEGKKQ